MIEMRQKWALLAGCGVAAVLMLPAAVQAQAPGSPEGPLWESYSRAAEVLRMGLEAHGGSAAIRELAGVSFRWDGQDFAPTQGRVPQLPWDTLASARAAMQDVRIDFARNRFIFDREFHFGGGYLNVFRIAGRGAEQLIMNPQPERGMAGPTFERDTLGIAARRTQAAAGANMPLVLLRSALARSSTLRHVGVVERNGAREEAISHTTVDGDLLTLYFDAATHRLVRREQMGVGSLGDEVDAFHFGDYAPRSGFLVPRLLEVTWNGNLASRYRLTAFAPSAEIPDSVFTVPAGYVTQAPARPPAVERIADGLAYVERLGGGYRMLVADVGEGLLVVDAPVSADVTRTAIRLIEEAFPGRPIRYVVITHHHADHIGGLAAFAALGATVLSAPGSEDYLRRMNAVPRTIGVVGARPPAPVVPRIETLTGRRTFGSGASAVEVIDVGPTSHAAAMLAVYVPSQQLLFQGDLLRINEHGGVVHAPAAASDLDGIIRRFRLDVRSIGAVHGINGTIDDLRAALERAAGR
ncbi:MAG: MBL fold metallo-hydrolase [Gemmatimonadaceae bacterium]|nr:MBL fold metallo-hydrolase [Gemmatimonadaceae bacterium]